MKETRDIEKNWELEDKEMLDIDVELDADEELDIDAELDAELDQRVDAIFAAFAKQLGDNTAAFASAFLDEEQPDPPLFMNEVEIPEAERKTVAPKGSRRLLRRTLILVAVLVLIMGLAVVTSEGVRLKVSSLIFGNAPDSTRLIDDSSLVVDLEKVELGYVPEGFEVESDEMIDDMYRVFCLENKMSDSILFSVTKTEGYVNNVDNERSGNEDVLINDKQGYYFTTNKRNSIIWQIGDCTFQLTSNLDKADLLLIAKQIVLH